jgi:dihydroxyacetone kinase phosphotransfer subunit
MVGIVVVSHSAELARAAVDLALQMVNGPAPRIEIAAGTADERLGTDAARVAQAIEAADDGEGVVVIMDLGSAILSAELALEFLPEPRIKTRLVPAAFVEGIFAAVISAAGGAQLDAVARDAEGALEAKSAQLDQAQLSQSQLPGDAVAPAISRPAIIAETTVVNPDGIHARPAALIVQTLASFDAQVTLATDRSEPVSARSPTGLMSLGARAGDVLRIEADGAGAATAIDRVVALIRDGFGEMRAEPVAGLRAQEGPLGVSPGRVVGPALRMSDPITEPDPTASLPEAERRPGSNDWQAPRLVWRISYVAGCARPAPWASCSRQPPQSLQTLSCLLTRVCVYGNAASPQSGQCGRRWKSRQTPCARPDPPRRYGYLISTASVTG